MSDDRLMNKVWLTSLKNISKIAKMQDPKSIVLCSAISEVFLRKLAKQGFIRYTEGSEFVDTREDVVEMGEADGGGLKEMDEKLRTQVMPWQGPLHMSAC